MKLVGLLFNIVFMVFLVEASVYNNYQAENAVRVVIWIGGIISGLSLIAVVSSEECRKISVKNKDNHMWSQGTDLLYDIAVITLLAYAGWFGLVTVYLLVVVASQHRYTLEAKQQND